MYCCRCGGATEVTVLVRLIETMSGPMRGNYACVPCGRWYGSRPDAPDWLRRDLRRRDLLRSDLPRREGAGQS